MNRRLWMQLDPTELEDEDDDDDLDEEDEGV